MSHIAPAKPSGRRSRQTAIGRNADLLPSFDTMRTNLLTTLAYATEDNWTEGTAWYLAARAIADDLAQRHLVTPLQAAGVLAALSPQTGWSENIRLADQALSERNATGHYDDACDKANAIIQGDTPANVLGGRKVRSFVRNIADPSRPGPVTVDRHAVDCLLGARGAVNSRILERPGAYALCAAVFRSVARELDILPHECQAVAWIAWRQVHDVAARYDADF